MQCKQIDHKSFGDTQRVVLRFVLAGITKMPLKPSKLHVLIAENFIFFLSIL